MDGLPLAVQAADEVRFLEPLDPAAAWEARNLILRRHVPAGIADPA